MRARRRGEPERLTDRPTTTCRGCGRRRRPAAPTVVAAVRSAGTTLPEVVVFEVAAKGVDGGRPRPSPRSTPRCAAELDAGRAASSAAGRATAARSRAGCCPAGHRPAAARRSRSTAARTPSTAGRRCSSGRSSPAPGSSVLATNPRGSEGYGEAFNRGQPRRLGRRPDGATSSPASTRPIADGLADPDRLGVTGGSYGGYLTNWIIGRTQRFKAARDLPLASSTWRCCS